MINVEKNKNTILEIFEETITRDGSRDLLNWLLNSDFFTAPASTRFHLAEEGGLAQHSLHVCARLNELCQAEEKRNPTFIAPTAETIAICGLLHDINKVNFYTVDYRNAKNEKGVWEKVPYYRVNDQFPYGHGEKSVYIINEFMHLTTEEAVAIRWHMGGFDDVVKGGSYALNGAFDQYPLAVMLHLADMQATYLDEANPS